MPRAFRYSRIFLPIAILNFSSSFTLLKMKHNEIKKGHFYVSLCQGSMLKNAHPLTTFQTPSPFTKYIPNDNPVTPSVLRLNTRFPNSMFSEQSKIPKDAL